MKIILFLLVCFFSLACTRTIFKERAADHSSFIKLIWKRKGAFNGITASYSDNKTSKRFHFTVLADFCDTIFYSRRPSNPKNYNSAEHGDFHVSKTGIQPANFTETEFLYLIKLKNIADSLRWRNNNILLRPNSLRLSLRKQKPSR